VNTLKDTAPFGQKKKLDSARKFSPESSYSLNHIDKGHGTLHE
jgi:hypothetical protein